MVTLEGKMGLFSERGVHWAGEAKHKLGHVKFCGEDASVKDITHPTVSQVCTCTSQVTTPAMVTA